MKIVIVNTLYSPYKFGGAEISVQLLAEELVKLDNDVLIITQHEFNDVKKTKLNNVNVCYLPLKNLYWPFKKKGLSIFKKIAWHILDSYNPLMYKLVENEIENFKPDVAHTNNLSGFSVALWSLFEKYNIPIVHTSRDYYLFHPNSVLYKNNKNQNPLDLDVRLWAWWKKKQSQKVSYYVGISDFIKDLHLKNGFFSNAVNETIYNPVNFYTKNSSKMNLDNKPSIGFIGRLTNDKGFNIFCDLALKNKNYNYVAAGEFTKSPESLRLEDLALKANIHLLGFVDFKDFIEQVDAVILPIQWNEPFGRVVVECAIAGVKVYTNKVGGVTELFSFFPNIFSLNDNLNLDKDTLGNFYKDTLSNIMIDERFNASYVAKKYLNIYSNLIA